MSRFAMSKIDLSRRQFVNVAAAVSGLYAMSGMSNLILGEEPQDVGLKKILGETDSKIPYIGIPALNVGCGFEQ